MGRRAKDSDGGSALTERASASADAAEADAQPRDDTRAPASTVPAGVTPSMAQFLEIKTANPDCILWYRMGDFYELFFEDAVVASDVLGIVLTKRGKHLGQDIPMCGVPVHRADEYLQRLIRRGYRVAVCEQLEDPAEARKRGSKAVVKRDVVRLVTPGTLTEESLLDAKARNYLTALFPLAQRGDDREQAALASLDISTGEFEVGLVALADLPGEMVRLAPGEILVPDTWQRDQRIVGPARLAAAAITPIAFVSFDSMAGERLLKERLGVSELGGFGAFTKPELAAIGALLGYVDLTQLGAKPVIRPPRRASASDALIIDASSRASLELLRSTSGAREGSLYAALDRTVTGPGARELAARIASPLADLKTIGQRLDAVAYLIERATLRDDIRSALRSSPDIARAVGRIVLGRGSPRDLGLVRSGLESAACIRALLAESAGAMGLAGDLVRVAERLEGAGSDLAGELQRAIVDDPGFLKRDGGFVRAGYRADLDEALRLRDDSRRVMASLEGSYIEATGVKTLKVRHNNILGFYIEVTQLNAKPLQTPPNDQLFRHRQTMANAMRFTTPELEAAEAKISSAAETALAIELDVFASLEARIRDAERTLGDVAAALAEVDCLAGLADLAEREGYVRPELHAGSGFEVRGGRHPVVEQALKAQKAGPFVDNDCVLGRAELPSQERDDGTPPTGFDESADGRIWLVTGPNMAGKSTFLRQNALIVVMAQMGSFVPAESARIGLVDRLFSRVGASDDLARGRSTFMVEMVETAAILNQATEKSLVILDEIGRGTATFDGLSIAWATVEHLYEVNKCRALFATHYHELTTLAGRLPEVANATIEVKEWHDEIVFLHKVRSGAADRSYGIQVAKLAGLPKAVIERAAEVLAVLEKGDGRAKGKGKLAPGSGGGLDELPLFAAARPKSFVTTKSEPSEVEKAITALNPDELTPKAALDALYRLKALAKKKD
ncbi:MAG: DNA mismatch repair protein MutS [Proteobacteria bacterium]|nr:DNA mismatch repair protein MutS [Pseudomonadota bacterium]